MKMTREEIEAFRHGAANDITRALCDLALSALDQEWRPIEEAPKDGTSILLSIPGHFENGHRAKWTHIHNYPLNRFHDYEISEKGSEEEVQAIKEWERMGWMSDHCQGEIHNPTHFKMLSKPPNP